MNLSIHRATIVKNRKTGERVSFDVPHYIKTGEVIITSTKMINTEDNCYVTLESPFRESLNAKN